MDFKQWIEKHLEIFPNVAIWLEQLGGSRLGQIESWREALSGCDFENCLRASRRIKDGTNDKPFAHEDWPRTIRAVVTEIEQEDRAMERAARKPPVFFEGVRSYECLRCRDEGLVICVHFDCYADARKNGERFLLKTMAVPCHCSYGDFHMAARKHVGRRKTDYPYHPHRFNERYFFPVSIIESVVVSPVDWSRPTAELLRLARTGEIEVHRDVSPFLHWVKTFDESVKGF